MGRPDLLGVEQPQDLGQAEGGIDIVVDDKDAARRGHWPVGLAAARRFVAGAGDGAGSRAGRRTTNSLPRPAPSLRAETEPPCSSTRLRTRVRPMPRPPWARSRRPCTCVNSSKMFGSIVRRDAHAGVPDPRSRPRRCSARPTRLIVPARGRCTWRRCSAGCRGSVPAGWGRPEGHGIGRELDRQCVAAVLDERAGGSHRPVDDPSRSTTSLRSSILPRLIRDTSSRSSTRRVMVLDLPLDASRGPPLDQVVVAAE